MQSATTTRAAVAESQPQRSVNVIRKSRDRLLSSEKFGASLGVICVRVWTRQITPTPPSGSVVRCDVDVYR